MQHSLFYRMAGCFADNATTFWANLSRLTGLLIIGNFSLFFLTGLVVRQGYYFTHISLGFLFAVELGLIIPLGLFGRFWYYYLILFFELAAIYFFVVSVWYWVSTSTV